MAECIYRDAAIAACHDGFADCRDDCIANIRNIPAADVVERKPLTEDEAELVERLKIAAEWAGKGFCITPNLCLEAAAAIENPNKERKIGEWVKISPAGIRECSLCRQSILTSDIDVYKFCFACGAKMEVPSDV